MKRTLQSLADVHQELVDIQQEFVRLQKRIDAMRDSVADSLTRIFGDARPAFSGLQEEELIERIAGRVAIRLSNVSKAQGREAGRYVRDVEAAAFLGVSVWTLRGWRSRGNPLGPPVTRIGRMVMYSVNELEKYMGGAY
jgi:hypothetical protein